MLPDSKNIVMTPIAPHNLNARPLVISDEIKIQLSVEGREKSHLLSLDSQIISLKNNVKIKIKKFITGATVRASLSALLKAYVFGITSAKITRNIVNKIVIKIRSN